jgi:poly(glycerol-phosphate) alpha-glucosyltransferase
MASELIKGADRMIYNFNLGIGWASSGVEYAQSYRAKLLRANGQKARFIFTDMFPRENIEHMTKNIGFLDEEVIWLYTFFTDQTIEPVTFTLKDLEETFGDASFSFSRKGKIGRCIFSGSNNFYTVYFTDEEKDLVHRVEYVSRGFLIRKDYFTSRRIYSEYYAPKDNRAHLYLRRFFQKDGSIAYEEIMDGEDETDAIFQFPDHICYGKQDLVAYLVQKLALTDRDTLIIDRTTGIGEAILENAGKARVGIIIHADHYSKNATNPDYILWNNYYEYDFSMHDHIDFYVTATETQKQTLRQQFRHYLDAEPEIYTIPVGALPELKKTDGPRRRHSVITASRLAREKHVDWAIEAVAEARKQIPDLTFDIYGVGGEENHLKSVIEKCKADSYIHLMGQADMSEVYLNYELYLSASMSEGFGLSVMEAIGSGLPVIGFDVPYGNPTFIREGENGYRINPEPLTSRPMKVRALAEKIVRLLTEDDWAAMSHTSYEIGENFLEERVREKWKTLLG